MDERAGVAPRHADHRSGSTSPEPDRGSRNRRSAPWGRRRESNPRQRSTPKWQVSTLRRRSTGATESRNMADGDANEQDVVPSGGPDGGRNRRLLWAGLGLLLVGVAVGVVVVLAFGGGDDSAPKVAVDDKALVPTSTTTPTTTTTTRTTTTTTTGGSARRPPPRHPAPGVARAAADRHRPVPRRPRRRTRRRPFDRRAIAQCRQTRRSSRTSSYARSSAVKRSSPSPGPP